MPPHDNEQIDGSACGEPRPVRPRSADTRAADGAVRSPMRAVDVIDDYRDAAKTADEQAVYHAPRWQVVAGIKDLLVDLVATVADACSNDERG